MLISLLFCSCSNAQFYDWRKKNYIFKEGYEPKKIVVKNYVLQSFLDTGILSKSRMEEMQEDSILNVFYNSLSQLELDIFIDSNARNMVNKDFHRNPRMKFRKIDKDYIVSMAESVGDSVTTIVPIISYYNYYVRPTTVSASSHATSISLLYNTSLKLSIFIVEEDKIIYYKAMYMKHVDRITDDKIDYRIKFEQEEWDGLVREVMKEYVERLN